MTFTPVPGAPRFTLQLNADGQALYGGQTTLEISIRCDKFPLGGHIFTIAGLVSGQWKILGNTDPGAMDIRDGSQGMQQVNAMGLKAWIQANICQKVNAVLKTLFGSKVTAALPPVNDPVTQANWANKVNEILPGLTFVDTDGDGVPELR